MNDSTVHGRPVDELDPALLEAAIVLLGTDPHRITTAIGLHLRTLDLGDLVLEVERVDHGRPDRTVASELHRRAGEWWLRQQHAMPAVSARAEQAAMSDPRTALPVLAAEIQRHAGSRLGEPTAVLLAVCFIARHGLTEAARAALEGGPPLEGGP